MLRYTLPICLLLWFASPAFAGTGYEITAQADGETVTYMVNFGGGFLFEQHTAYDPVSKKFVYLQWKRDAEAPKPVGAIWDHETGRTIQLYQFPGVKHPLPAIPNIEAIKVCPRTGDRDFKFRAVIAYD